MASWADADALYERLERLVKQVAADPQMVKLMTNLERRRVPSWLRTKRAQIADIRANLKAAKAAEDAGDLASAAHAYVGLIRKYEYIRFETVFSIPMRVTTIPPGTAIAVNGEPAGMSPTIIRYAWGSQTTVTASASGYEPSTVLLRTADDDPETDLVLRLGPKPLWTVPVEPNVEMAPVEVDGDVVTMDRTGRIARYDARTGRIRWARHYDKLQGVRARPVLSGSSIHVAMVDGEVLFLDPSTGNKRSSIQIGRPVGDVAVEGNAVGVATSGREFVGIRNGRVSFRRPLAGTPHVGTVGAHGAFWIGTNDGRVIRVHATTGESRVISLNVGSAPILGLAKAPAGVLVTTAAGSVVYLSSNGHVRWANQDVGDLVGEAAEAAGTVAVGDRRGRVLFFSSGRGEPQGGVDLTGAPRSGLVSVGGVVLTTLDTGQLWGWDAARKRVRFDVPLEGTARFPVAVVKGDHVVVSRDGLQMSLLRVPSALESK